MQSKLIVWHCGQESQLQGAELNGVRLVEITSECLIWTDPNLSSNIDRGPKVFLFLHVFSDRIPGP